MLLDPYLLVLPAKARDVLIFLCQGKSLQLIQEECHIGQRQLSNYLRDLKTYFQMDDLYEIVAHCFNNQLVKRQSDN